MRTPDNNPQRFTLPAWLIVASVLGLLLGLVGLIWTFIADPFGGWGWLVTNFVYFVGIANGTLLWSMVFRATQTRWTASINRLAHSMMASVPLLAIVLIVLLIGVRGYMTWIYHPAHNKEAWLNVPFLVVRNLIVTLVFWGLGWMLMRWSLALDTKEDITPEEHHRLNIVAVAGVLVYTVTMTVISYDFIMSLWPEWFSTMFAPYYFSTSAYTGLATLILLSAALRRPLRVERYIGPQQFQDLGNLMLGFALFNMGLFFAQYLTIWYENLPFETDFLIVRYLRGPWPIWGWMAFILGYAIPFIVLQSKSLKRNPKMLAPVAVLVLVGVALERYVLVVPSLNPAAVLLYPTGLLMGLGFVGALVLTVGWFARTYPPVSEADAELKEMITQEAGV